MLVTMENKLHRISLTLYVTSLWQVYVSCATTLANLIHCMKIMQSSSVNNKQKRAGVQISIKIIKYKYKMQI